ncbi:MAG: hypothetical protein HY393_00755 [Candidatus Diapherotrites archaeon]|nr:hypothetical protein [Candidatus Diapherotrites archaeon]
MHTNIEALAQLPLARLNTIERELNAFQTQNVQAQELKGVYLSLVHTFQANAQYDLIVSELKQAQGFCANVSKYDQAAQWAKTLSNESVTFESKANEFATAYPVESAAIQFNALGSTLTISKQETEEQIALLDAFKGLCESELA